MGIYDRLTQLYR